jgi:imidazolonepropionase-like amidohydrolase
MRSTGSIGVPPVTGVPPVKRRRCVCPPTLVVALSAAALLTTANASGQASSTRRGIQAAAYVDAEGRIATGGVLVIDGEKIVQVGGDTPADLPVDAYPGAVLCPGLIDCHSALGAFGGLSERQQAVQPRVNARDAFDRYARQLRQALAAGVTTFALAPDDRNLIGGQIAICQTAGPDGQPRLLTDAGPLKLSLSAETFRPDRDPTSRSGALGLLRDTLEAARGDDPLAAFAAGRLTGFVTAPSGADVLACLQLAQDYGLRLVPIHTVDARRVAETVAGRVAGIVIGPFDLTTGQRAAVAAGLFARHGTPVAIAGGLPAWPADGLRTAAAVAARNGLAPPAARRAITAVPAELLGIGDRVGELSAGHQADVVVFSGDPLDLRSRVLTVYVAGRRAYWAQAAEEQR